MELWCEPRIGARKKKLKRFSSHPFPFVHISVFFSEMVQTCAVSVCKNNSRKSPALSFYKFPKKSKIHEVWKTFCRREDGFTVTPDSKICREHFKDEDYRRTTTGCMELTEPVSKITDSDITSKKPRQEYPIQMEVVSENEENVILHDHLYNVSSTDSTRPPPVKCSNEKGNDKACQTDLSGEDIAMQLDGKIVGKILSTRPRPGPGCSKQG